MAQNVNKMRTSINEHRIKATLQKKFNYGQGIGVKTRLEFLCYASKKGAKIEHYKRRNFAAEEKLANEIDNEKRGWNVPGGNEKHPATIRHMEKRRRLAEGIYKDVYYINFGSFGFEITKIEYDYFNDNLLRPTQKTPECSQVLQLMDQDVSYQEALNTVLNNSSISRNELESELNTYI